jgi:hypothetical protein
MQDIVIDSFIKNWYAFVIPALVVGLAWIALSSAFGGKKKPVDAQLHDLRDAGARKFVAKLEAQLMMQASRGRSDYEFYFRPYDVWLDVVWVAGVLPIPCVASFWDCIDSAGSREVVKAMLEGQGSGQGSTSLRVDWCISTQYRQGFFAPKWVLSCKWDRVELRRNQYGGR